jgi:hypothetical protein
MSLNMDPLASDRDPFSDSDVLRILGDYRPTSSRPTEASPAGAIAEPTKCPRCREQLIPTARVCVHCNLYISASAEDLQNAYRAVRRQLKLPPKRA